MLLQPLISHQFGQLASMHYVGTSPVVFSLLDGCRQPASLQFPYKNRKKEFGLPSAIFA